MKVAALLLLVVLLGALPLAAQPRVSPEHLYERVLAIVPMSEGAGTREDPKRPMFTANPRAKSRNLALATAAEPPENVDEEGRDTRGIIAFSYVLSDDEQYALVEFVATDVRSLRPILEANRPDVKVFRLGRTTKEEVETEFRRHKSNFDLQQLPRVTP